MERFEDQNWLDEALTEAIGSEGKKPDFEKWKAEHPEAVEMLTSRADGRPSAPTRPLNIGRIIMKSPITKLAAAAVIIIGALVSINLLDKSIPKAYALVHTIEANHTVRYLHIKDFSSEHKDEPKEIWVECGELGQIENARMHMPEWDSPDDGAKAIVWNQNKVQVYFKKKNLLFIAADKTVADRMLMLVQECDPRLAVKRLYEQKTAGKVKIEIDEPSDKTKPIVVTATYLPESSSPHRRVVLFVDQATKLVTATEFYQLKDDEYQYTGVQEYYDYNQTIDAKMFTLDAEVPADVMRIDQTIQDVGLAQGNLSDEEVAVEVARQFFEALIAADYAKAGKLLEGIPADRMQQELGHIKYLRIISIGPAGPHPNPKTGGLVVPCTVEIEKDGQISEWKLNRLGVRQVFNQPGRWTIFGGI
ncbi:MAG TPA: hypothetical protein VMY06_06965 [Sedimentisphaerales bacterium]|nr:hypothetical protein [Sedimentisphaerales bacterium]